MLELSKGAQLAERYTLERPLGRGGEAQTWLAMDRLTRASVALKIVPAAGVASERLRQEWQTNLRLMHPHIVRVFEFHEDQGVAFYSLQYVPGADLGALTAKPLTEILPPIGLIADALRYAHSKGIVHRDVKASNVLLDHNGAPYLSDFGVAAEAGSVASGGSPVAASPQSQMGEAAQAADDVFALGTLLFEVISGAPPLHGDEGLESLRAASGDTIPQPVLELVTRMLDKDAARRPDAGEVAGALQNAGFAPGPARSQKAARPVMEDERVETVAAVRHARTPTVESSKAALTQDSPGISPRTMLIALAALVGLLLGVVFLLPDAVQETDGTARESTTAFPGEGGASESPLVEADVPGSSAESDIDRISRDYEPENKALDGEEIEFNENDADYTGLDDGGKLRYKVEMILGELLSSFETLERRSVQRWAQVPYRRARELYALGDEAFLKRRWADAEAHYLDALSLLEPLFEQVEPEFEKALAGAAAAFDAENGLKRCGFTSWRSQSLPIIRKPVPDSSAPGIWKPCYSLSIRASSTRRSLSWTRRNRVSRRRRNLIQTGCLQPKDWSGFLLLEPRCSSIRA